MYYQYKPRKWIVYWFFSARNMARYPLSGSVAHEGDWERVAVRLDGRNRATMVAWWQHNCKRPQTHRWDERGDFHIVGRSHPAAYIAYGGHATYPQAGQTELACPATSLLGVFSGGDDSHRGGGVTWSTWQDGEDGFQDARTAAWYGYGGSWGDKTRQSPDSFWGPLGPSKYKKPQPDGW
jgi:hypothetical protein